MYMFDARTLVQVALAGSSFSCARSDKGLCLEQLMRYVQAMYRRLAIVF